MDEVEKFNVRQAGQWLAGEVEIRVSKKWLAVAMAAVAILVLMALD